MDDKCQTSDDHCGKVWQLWNWEHKRRGPGWGNWIWGEVWARLPSCSQASQTSHYGRVSAPPTSGCLCPRWSLPGSQGSSGAWITWVTPVGNSISLTSFDDLKGTKESYWSCRASGLHCPFINCVITWWYELKELCGFGEEWNGSS